MDWYMFLTKLSAVIVLVLSLADTSNGLNPKGANVCGYDCRKFHWEIELKPKPCQPDEGDSQNVCYYKTRKPVVTTTKCYECCSGWREDPFSEQCDTFCSTGESGIVSCKDVPEGWYQLCDSCRHFARCDKDGQLHRKRCPPNYVWDDKAKNCLRESRTCSATYTNGLEYQTEPDIDRHNELTNEVEMPLKTPSVDKDTKRNDCQSMGCPARSTCVMMYSNDDRVMQPKCICPPGTKLTSNGQLSCTKISNCSRSLCQHGTCIERRYGYKCACEQGWRGRYCHKPRKSGRSKTHRKTSRAGKGNKKTSHE